MIEELPGGGEHRRPPRYVAMPHYTNPFALEQGLDDLAVHRHASHVFDFTASNRLAIGDQHQGFQQRPRIALWPLFPEAPDPGRKALAHLQPVTAGHFLQFERATLAGLVQ